MKLPWKKATDEDADYAECPSCDRIINVKHARRINLEKGKEILDTIMCDDCLRVGREKPKYLA